VTSANWYDLRFIDEKTAIMLTRESTVFRSTDLGQTWENLNSKLLLSSVLGNEPGFLYPSSTDENKIYIRGNGQVCWISNDKGETWRSVFPGRLIFNLEWHPTNSEWALAVDEVGNLHVTRDFGMTWLFITDGQFGYSWGDAGLGSVPENRIYIVRQTGSYRDFVQTDDWGTTFLTIQPRGFDFIFGIHQVFAAVELPATEEAALKVSPDINMEYKLFLEATFPFGDDLVYGGYAILDDYTGSVFMGIIHSYDITNNWGNLYVSDSTGSRYSLALRGIHQYRGIFDFVRVEGLEAIYFANILTNTNDPDSPLKSVMSFDDGSTWSTIAAPLTDSLGNKIVCTGGCSLQLHGWSSFVPTEDHPSYGPFYTNENAIGLILANGNVGTQLEFDTQLVNTYLSSDGGLSWIELRKGPSSYRFGDHGGIIVLIDSLNYVTNVYYTLDAGNTGLQSFTFGTEPIKAFRIFTELSATEERFMIFGNTEQGINDRVIGLDFSTVFSRVCDPLSDYDQWIPSNGLVDCIQGHRSVYMRRNMTKLCFNNEDMVHPVSVTNCRCTEDDWECDIYYERGTDGTCVLTGNTPIFPPEHCPEGTYYNKSVGYRKEAGNTCNGGVDHKAEGPFECPPAPRSTKGWVAAVVVVLIVVAIIVLAVIGMKSERLREKLPFLRFLGSINIGYFKPGSKSQSLYDDEDNSELFIQTEDVDEQHHTIEDKTEVKSPKKDLLSTDVESDEFNPRA